MKLETAQSFFTQSSDCVKNPEELLLEVLAVPLSRTMEKTAASYDITVIGKVVAVGEAARGTYTVREGDLVYLEHSIMCLTCKHCMSRNYSACLVQKGYRMLPAQLGRYLRVVPGSRLHKLPDDISVAQAALCFYAERALHTVVTKGMGRLGTSLLLAGCDLAGLFCALAAKSAGLTPVRVLVEKDEPAAWLAAFLSESEIAVGLADDERFDIVVANTDSASLLTQAAEHFNPLGRCVCLRDTAPAFSERMLRNELTVTGALHPSAMADKGMLLLRKNASLLETIESLSYPVASFSEAVAEAHNAGWIKSILLVPDEK